MFLGGINNDCFLSSDDKRRLPAITRLGEKFQDFQNSQWRGEWDQKTSLTFGEIRDFLREVSHLIVENKTNGTP